MGKTDGYDEICAADLPYGAQNPRMERGAIDKSFPAKLIDAQIGSRPQKLVEEEAMGTMEFNAVRPGSLCEARAVRIGLNRFLKIFAGCGLSLFEAGLAEPGR